MTRELSGLQPKFLTMRPVELSDGANILAWRNADVVRRFSRNKTKISELEHMEWLKLRLSEDFGTTRLFFFEDNGEPVGTSRFDTIETFQAEISILVNPIMLGKGYGISILALTLDEGVANLKIKQFKAAIHKDNLPSIKLFSRFGFQKSNQEGSFANYFYNSEV